jgi:hypothetical protein
VILQPEAFKSLLRDPPIDVIPPERMLRQDTPHRGISFLIKKASQLLQRDPSPLRGSG